MSVRNCEITNCEITNKKKLKEFSTSFLYTSIVTIVKP